MKCIAKRLASGAAAIAVAVFSSQAGAAENPGAALQSQFNAAKVFLSAGDLTSAEDHYIATISLGLRQQTQLSVAAGQLDQAASYLDSVLKLDPNDVEAQVGAADLCFRKGELAKAKAMLHATIAKNPAHVRALRLMGRIDVFEGDFYSAIQELKASIKLQSDFETSYLLGIALLKARELDEASAWFHQLETNVGNSAALHVLFGRAYLIAKYSQQAIREFAKAIELDPTYPRAHGFLGYSYLEYYQEEGYPRARQEFKKELRLNPRDYRVQELLGIADVNLRDFPAAKAALLQAIRLKPEEASPYLYLGETYTATDSIERAVEVLEKYVELVGSPGQDKQREASRAYYLLGQNLRRLGRDEEAKKALLRSQQIREAKFKYDVQHIFEEQKQSNDAGESRVSDQVADLLNKGSAEASQSTQNMIQQGLPANRRENPAASPKESAGTKQYRGFVAQILGSSYNDLGVMRTKQTKFREAAEFFRQASAWQPGLPGLDRNWGLASFRAELYEEAVPPLERQLKANPNDTFVRQLLGLSYSILERDERVVEVLRPFLEHPPDDPGLLFAWGTALVHMHESEAAASIFRRLLEQNSDNPSIHLLLGQADAQQENYPDAINQFTSALQINPQLSEAHYYAGLVYLRQNDFESAAREFRAELNLRPNEPHTMYHLGYTLLLENQLVESVSLLREVTKMLPDYELGYFELGRALLQQGDVTSAIENLETAKKLAPDHDAAYFQLGQAYRRAGRAQEAAKAMADYKKLIEAQRQSRRQSLEMDKP